MFRAGLRKMPFDGTCRMSRNRKWSEDEISGIINNYPRIRVRNLAILMERTMNAIMLKITELRKVGRM